MTPTTSLATSTTASPEMLRLLAEWEQSDPTPHQLRMQAASDRQALVADAMRTHLTETGHEYGAVRQITSYVQRGDRAMIKQRVSQILGKADEVRASVARLSAALVGGCLSAADHEAEARHLALALDLPYGPELAVDLPGWRGHDHDWTAPSGTAYSVYRHSETRPGLVAHQIRVVHVGAWDVCYTEEAR